LEQLKKKNPTKAKAWTLLDAKVRGYMSKKKIKSCTGQVLGAFLKKSDWSNTGAKKMTAALIKLGFNVKDTETVGLMMISLPPTKSTKSTAAAVEIKKGEKKTTKAVNTNDELVLEYLHICLKNSGGVASFEFLSGQLNPNARKDSGATNQIKLLKEQHGSFKLFAKKHFVFWTKKNVTKSKDKFSNTYLTSPSLWINRRIIDDYVRSLPSSGMQVLGGTGEEEGESKTSTTSKTSMEPFLTKEQIDLRKAVQQLTAEKAKAERLDKLMKVAESKNFMKQRLCNMCNLEKKYKDYTYREWEGSPEKQRKCKWCISKVAVKETKRKAKGKEAAVATSSPPPPNPGTWKFVEEPFVFKNIHPVTGEKFRMGVFVRLRAEALAMHKQKQSEREMKQQGEWQKKHQTYLDYQRDQRNSARKGRATSKVLPGGRKVRLYQPPVAAVSSATSKTAAKDKYRQERDLERLYENGTISDLEYADALAKASLPVPRWLWQLADNQREREAKEKEEAMEKAAAYEIAREAEEEEEMIARRLAKVSFLTDFWTLFLTDT
jgi:hypothetical protein